MDLVAVVSAGFFVSGKIPCHGRATQLVVVLALLLLSSMIRLAWLFWAGLWRMEQ